MLPTKNREGPEIIDSCREGNHWDYKREWHGDKSELLHDILCLANNLESETSYLIIGIDENDGHHAVDVVNQEHRKSTQDITDWFCKLSWYGGIRPNVIVEQMVSQGKIIDIVLIETQPEAYPYCLTKPNGKVGAYRVYVRRNDTNTPIDSAATWAETEALWKRHFKLDLAPLDRIPEMLKDKENWIDKSTIYCTRSKYYRYDPSFTIEIGDEDGRNGYEYYMLMQTNTDPYWGNLKIGYLGNQIYDCLTIALDGGRYTTVVPERSFFRWWASNSLDCDITYCYYLADSLDWALHEFLYEEDSGDSEIAHDRFMPWVLVFHNDNERRDFEHFLKSVREEFEFRVADVKEGYLQLPDNYSERGRKYLADQIKHVTILQELLEEYRNGRWADNRAGKASRGW